MKELLLIGGGGHCKSCIDVIEQEGTYRIAGIVDVSEKMNQKILGYKVIATDAGLPRLVKEHENFLVTMGQIKSADKRIRLFEKIKELGGKLPVIISPLAYVSRHASIEEGTIVLHHSLVNAEARIGRNCIINTGALIEHDVLIEDHCHVATNAVINGGVKIGRGTFFGSNSVAREYIEIGNNCVIGMGTSLLQKVLPGESGNPARMRDK